MSAPWYDPRIARGMAAQLTRWHERIKAGEKPLGWKAGFGTPAAMEQLKTTAPLVGFLTDRSALETGARVRLEGWVRPAAEPEIAIYLGKTLPGGASRETAKAAIAGIAPAIELADLDRPPDDVAEILARNVYQRHVIIGKCDRSRAGCRLDGLTAVIARNGTEVERTADPQAATGDIVDIVRHVADLLGAFGEPLRAGQVILAGSIVPPLWVAPGETLVFSLDPVGSLSARFA